MKIHKNNHGFAALELLLVLVIIGVIGFAGWYVWNAKQSTQEALTTDSSSVTSVDKADSGTSKAEEPLTSADATPDLMPGDTDTRRPDGRILVTAMFKTGLEPSALWVEYGTDPAKIDKTSAKITSELGMGDPGQPYQGFSASISNSELKPGTTYYYRAAATIKGQTQQSAIASFVTDK